MRLLDEVVDFPVSCTRASYILMPLAHYLADRISELQYRTCRKRSSTLYRKHYVGIASDEVLHTMLDP